MSAFTTIDPFDSANCCEQKAKTFCFLYAASSIHIQLILFFNWQVLCERKPLIESCKSRRKSLVINSDSTYPFQWQKERQRIGWKKWKEKKNNNSFTSWHKDINAEPSELLCSHRENTPTHTQTHKRAHKNVIVWRQMSKLFLKFYEWSRKKKNKPNAHMTLNIENIHSEFQSLTENTNGYMNI